MCVYVCVCVCGGGGGMREGNLTSFSTGLQYTVLQEHVVQHQIMGDERILSSHDMRWISRTRQPSPATPRTLREVTNTILLHLYSVAVSSLYDHCLQVSGRGEWHQLSQPVQLHCLIHLRYL